MNTIIGQEGAPDGELALVVLQDGHDCKGVLSHVVNALQEAAHLHTVLS